MSTQTHAPATPLTTVSTAAPVLAAPPAPIVQRALIGHYVRLEVRAIAIWGLALGAMIALIVAIYPSIGSQVDDMLANYPPELQAFFGASSSAGTIQGFLALEVFNFLGPIALAFYPILLGARAIAGAEERGALDIFLSNPLARWQVVASTFATMIVALLGVATLLGLCAWIPALLAGVALPVSAIVAAVLNLVPLCLFFGALALLTSAVAHRGGLAIAIPGGVLLVMYVVNALGELAEALKPLRPLSVFYHYGSAIEHGIDWPSFAAITLLAALLAALAAAAFTRRDLYT
jgi:ABC-2 type transport system permease protein